jgi:serine/threonine protein kinase
MTADGADPSPVIPGTTALIGGETTDPIGEDLASLVGIPHSDRYQLGETLGTGGMGEVLSALDTHIGREVAVKRLRATALKGGEIARFVGEARVQGRLDHPAIVPIHDLAVDDAGRPFFSMKKLTGVTLHEVIHNGDANAAAWTRARLLGAFVDVT